jgi:hypothetical protein
MHLTDPDHLTGLGSLDERDDIANAAQITAWVCSKPGAALCAASTSGSCYCQTSIAWSPATGAACLRFSLGGNHTSVSRSDGQSSYSDRSSSILEQGIMISVNGTTALTELPPR